MTAADVFAWALALAGSAVAVVAALMVIFRLIEWGTRPSPTEHRNVRALSDLETGGE